MKISPSIRLAASGVLLVAFGFLCGLLSGGPRGHRVPHPPQPGYAVAPMQVGQYSQAVAWRSDYPGTTVVVIRQEQPPQVAMAVPYYPQAVAIANPAPQESRAGLWLALLLALGVGPLTWFALNWRREQRNAPFVEDPYMETFVPRRDD